MANTFNLNPPYIAAGQAQKHITHNEAIKALDAIVQIGVIDRDLTIPPGSPVDGERYIVPALATGIWAGKDTQIAAWQDGVWMFYTPQTGWLAYVSNENELVVWDGASWSAAGGGAVNPASLIGVNATADISNRLSVSSPNTLFNHEGSDHRVKINKNGVADTASFLFQTNWSARAEIGLAGDDDFRFKVSADGSIWNESFSIDAGTGEPNFAQPLSLKQYAKAALPDATSSGRLIYVYDATGGACVAFCDGGSWKRISDNTTIN